MKKNLSPPPGPSPVHWVSEVDYYEQEAGSGAEQERRKDERVKANLYKTEMCRSFEETGNCKYGPKCQFAHGAHELRNINRHPRYKTEICKTFHTIGTCPYGKRCRFIHMNGIPRVWEASYPLNYLILHEDRGPQELSTSELVLDDFLRILDTMDNAPELAPELAYFAKLACKNSLGHENLEAIRQGTPPYVQHRLPVFQTVEAKFAPLPKHQKKMMDSGVMITGERFSTPVYGS